MIKWDGHTHTRFCKHGHDAEQELYIERALDLGFERYTLSEHPPLPEGWVDNPKLMQELAMEMSELPAYLEYALAVKKRYAGILDVTVGLEMDYLDGAESFSREVIAKCGGVLEDAVVSVHFLPGAGGMRCIDFTPADFREGLLEPYGSMESLVDAYYDHVEKAIAWAGSLDIPRKRIGHINLIEKFSTELPPIAEEQTERRLRRLIPLLQEAGAGIDVNTAGLRVATCGHPYARDWFIQACREKGIACVYGSDSHRSDHVGTGWDWYAAVMSR